MEQHQPADSGLNSEPSHSVRIRMSPSPSQHQLLGKVLTVVDQEIRASAEFDEISKTGTLPAIFAQLIVRKKHKRYGSLDELESHSSLRMLQAVSLYARVSNPQGTMSQIVSGLNFGFEVIETYGPGPVDVSGTEDVLQAFETLGKAVNDNSTIVVE